MKWIIPLMLVMAGLMSAHAQDNPFYRNDQVNRFSPTYSYGGFGSFQQHPGLHPGKKADVGVRLGTSFSTDFGKGYAFSTYAAPELRYRISDRFSLRAGLEVSNTEYSNSMIYSPYGFGRYNGNITQGMLYVSGDYMIRQGIILSGTAFKEFSIDHANPENAFRPGYDGRGLMMNLRLIPSDNTMIEIGAEFYQGDNPWRGGTHNPFYGPARPYW
jgi:hypothetical protein